MKRFRSAFNPASSTMRSGTLLVGSSWRMGGTDASVCAMSASSSAGLRLGAGLGLVVEIGLGLARPPLGPDGGDGGGLETAQAAASVADTSATMMRVASLAARGRSGIGES